MRPRATRILAQAALLLGSCLVALAGAELAVRVLDPHARDHVLPAGLLEMDARLGWRLASSRVGVHRSRYFEVEYRSNEQGFRDVEREPVGRPAVRRVLVYGDSQVFGWGVARERRFTDVLEARTDRVEFWNLGVPGYGLGQQVLAYESSGAALDTDEVAFLVSRWTLLRLPYRTLFRKPKPRFRLDDAGGLRLDPVDADARVLSSRLYALLSPLYLPYFVDRRIRQLRRPQTAEPPSTLPRELPHRELAEQVLLRARRVARSHGHRVTLLADLSDPAAVTHLERFAAHHGMEVLRIALDPADDGLVFGPRDPHWTEEAHRRIAAQLAPPWLGRLSTSSRGEAHSPAGGAIGTGGAGGRASMVASRRARLRATHALPASE